MKDKTDFLKILKRIPNVSSGKFYASDQSVQCFKSENIEIYPRAVFDIPLSGRKKIRLSEKGNVKEVIMKPGDILFTKAGDWKCTEWDLPHELMCIVIDPMYLRFTYVDYRRPDPLQKRPICRDYYHTFHAPSRLIMDLLNNLILLTEENISEAAMLMSRTIIIAAGDFLRRDTEKKQFQKGERTYRLLLQYISENFAGNISRRNAAEYFHLNPCYISHLFQERGQKKFSSLIRDHRMEHAAYLLKSSNMLLDEIALQCGYSSTQTFNTIFRKYYGMPPGQYRSHIKSVIL